MKKNAVFMKRIVSFLLCLALCLPLIGSNRFLLRASAATPADIVNEARRRIGSTAYNKNGDNFCLGFVQDVYAAVGLGFTRYGSAQIAANNLSLNKNRDIPFGAMIYFSTSSGYGHVGIYTGNDMMVHANAKTRTVQENSVTSYMGSWGAYLGWTWGPHTPEIGHVMSEGEAAGQSIPDGDYYIVCGISPNYFLDIPGNDFNTGNGANIQMWRWGDMPPAEGFDCFHFEYLNNGFYKITQINSGMCLDVDGGPLYMGANIQMWGANGSNAQQWSVEPTSHGYRLRARCSAYCMDVEGGTYADGVNVRIWASNDSNAQSFGLIPRAPEEQPLPDGVYTIRTNVNTDHFLDASGTAEEYADGTNIQIWEGKSTEEAEQFRIEYAGEGWHRIYENRSGLAMGINAPGAHFLASKTNVQLQTDDGGKPQLWKLCKNEDGSFCIINKDSGFYLDLEDSGLENGTNVSQHFHNGAAAQRWIIAAAAYTLEVIACVDGTPAGDGFRGLSFDVTADGKLLAEDVSYFRQDFREITKYEISDIRTEGCYAYTGHPLLSGDLDASAAITLDVTTNHTPEEIPAVPATCLEPGVWAGSKCAVCGLTLSEPTPTPALGHTYGMRRVSPTCTEDAKNLFTCIRCGDSYTEPVTPEVTYTEWSETAPIPGKNDTLETRTEYRTAVRRSVWEKTGEGTIDYAAGWPAGFNTDSDLYHTYSQTPKTAAETETARTEVITERVGYIYWHHCYNSYQYGPINRKISDTQSGEFPGFHAFFSTEDIPVTESANARRFDQKPVCADTYWWSVNRVEILRCTYTEYTKTAGDEWGEWSDWSETKPEEAPDLRIGTRTLYRLKTTEDIKATGHSWDSGTILRAPTAAEEGIKVYTCVNPGCTEAKTEKIPVLGFLPGDVNLDGKVTAADARLALRKAVGLEAYAEGSAQFRAADVTADGKITAADARKILRAAVGLETLA